MIRAALFSGIRVSRRTVRGGVVALCALAVASSAVAAGSPADAAAPHVRSTLVTDRTPTSWQSGVYSGGCGTTPVTAFGAWRGSKVRRTGAYLDNTTWASLVDLGPLSRCLPSGLAVSLSVPLFAKGANLVDGAAGAYDAYWTQFGKSAVKNGFAGATLRLGWEMNGSYFAWRATDDPAHFRAYWRQIVRTLKAVPGQHFRYEWAPNLGSGSGFKVELAYPGNAYVTYIGSTIYDTNGKTAATASQRWKRIKTEKYGLNWLAAFAKAHHKRIGISEWGLASEASFQGRGVGDDAYFVTHMYAWMKSAKVVYDVYFNRLHPPNEHRLFLGDGTNPTFAKAAKAYRETFGGA